MIKKYGDSFKIIGNREVLGKIENIGKRQGIPSRLPLQWAGVLPHIRNPLNFSPQSLYCQPALFPMRKIPKQVSNWSLWCCTDFSPCVSLYCPCNKEILLFLSPSVITPLFLEWISNFSSSRTCFQSILINSDHFGGKLVGVIPL